MYTDMFEGGPSPSTFVANTATVMLEEILHIEEESSNQSVQILLPQEEAAIVVKPQMLPEMESM